MEKWKTRWGRVYHFPTGPATRNKKTTRERTQTPKEGGLPTADIDDKTESDPAVSSCRDPAVLVDAGQEGAEGGW